jgi:hypothetical protein
MPGSQLNTRFNSNYGDRRIPEQILMIPFRDGDEVKYFVVRGICEDDRRITRCDMIRRMNWEQLIKYLGEV